jgi:hypothetical protein
MTHRIRHQILELELPREAGAVALQRRASRVFQEQVLPRLDEAFSRIAPADRVVRIEHLELDLGEIAEANWERDFVEKCVQQISQQVAEKAFEVNAEESVKTLSAEENAVAVFRHFLEMGTLPWYAKHLTLSELEQMVDKNLAGGSAFWRQEIRRLLKQNDHALQRLLWQFSVAFAEKVVAAAVGLPLDWIQQAKQIRQSQTGQKTTDQAFVVLAKYLLGTDLSVLKNTLPEAALLAQIFSEEALSSVKPTQINARQESEKPSHKRPHTSDPEGFLIDNAGLVLLAVYLPPFFKKLGIEIQSPLDQSPVTNHQRAIHLLHFLSTGQEHPEEPVLVLPKILCGLSLETPIPKDFDLTEEEKIEATRLLEAIVRNWPVLKNTSPDGLRSGFIKRAGLLSWSEDRASWVLRVERLGQDLLLEKVPWSYSVIKLPWMEEMLQVEW